MIYIFSYGSAYSRAYYSAYSRASSSFFSAFIRSSICAFRYAYLNCIVFPYIIFNKFNKLFLIKL